MSGQPPVPSNVCPTCRELVPQAGYRAHRQQHDRQRGSWSKGRDHKTQDRFRRAVLANAGYRCQPTEDGQRCSVTRPLQAHHLEPGNDNPAAGVALCQLHHRQMDRHAR